MAASILKGLRFPKFVSLMEIQLGAKGSLGLIARNSGGSDLTVKNGVVSFQRKDLAIPFFPE
jgi:hypothetical protein